MARPKIDSERFVPGVKNSFGPVVGRAPQALDREKSEAQIQAEILLELGSRSDVRLWRASVLTARDIRTGKTYTAGLPGQADLTGFIQPEGWRLEVEVKTATGKQGKDQATFERVITSGGGCYLLVRSVEEASAKLDAWIGARRARGCPHCASGSLEHQDRCRCCCHAINRSGE